MAFDTATGFLYVDNSNSDNVSVINATTLTPLTSVTVGRTPVSIAFDPQDGDLYVVNQASDTISVIDGANESVISSWSNPLHTLTGSLRAIAYDGATGALLLTGPAEAGVINATTGSLTTTIPLLNTGGCGCPYNNAVLFDAIDSKLYVSVANFSEVVVLNASTYAVITTVTGVPFAGAGTVDTLNGNVFVSELDNLDPLNVVGTNSSTVEIAAGNNSVVGTFPVGGVSLAFDNASDLLFVASGDYSLTAWNCSTDQLAGTVPLGGFGPTAVDFLPSLKVVEIALEIGGADGEVELYATPDYIASFNETRLPAGQVWGVSQGPGSASNVTGPTDGVVLFLLPNGTYSFTVDPLVGWTPYSPTPASGNVTVSGGAVDVSIQFQLAPVFNVTLSERGLQSGAAWGVTTGANPVTNSTVGTVLSIKERRGSIPLSVHAPPGYAANRLVGSGVASNLGEFNVSASEMLVLRFGPVESVTFNQSPLSKFELYPGANWGVSIVPAKKGGPPPVSEESTGASIVFSLPEGAAYRFTVSSPGTEYSPAPAHGTFTVPHHALAKVVRFKLLTVTVVFRESGLPGGQAWSVNLTGGSSPAVRYADTESAFAGRAIVFKLPVGTYNFSVSTTALSEVPTPGSPQVVVTQAPGPRHPVTIVFSG